MGGWAVEFDFVEDESGNGKFVTSGDASRQIHTLIGRGEIDQASRIYEELGRDSTAALIEEARLASSTTRKAMAEMFRRARDFLSAAQVCAMDAAHAEAAAFYEQGGDFASAAACHQRAGDEARAAAAYERSGKPELALELYRKAGADPSVAECLARLGRFAEAAALYGKLKNVHAEVEMLRQVPMDHPQRIPATRRLAALMEHYNHPGEAVQVLMGTLRKVEAARKDPELGAQLLRLLEQLGKHDTAKWVREALGSAAGGAEPEPGALVLDGEVEGEDASDPDAYAYLKAIPIFAELDMADMQALFRASKACAFSAGKVIIEQGAVGAGLVVLVEGIVDVVAASPTGVTKPLNELHAGAYVGEISLVGEAPTSARVIARTAVRGLFISREAFNQYLYGHPLAAMKIYRLFTHNLAARVRALSAS